MNHSSPLPDSPKSSGRAYLWLGFLLGLLGPLLYAGQLAAKRLTVPWYVPVLGTVGAMFVVLALARGRGWVRMVCGCLLVLLAAFEWYFLLSLSKTPPYTGPVAVGKPLPIFASQWADGSPCTQAALVGEKMVLVFFRGRW